MASKTVGHEPLVGQALGHYRIIEKIGSGGMGVVYRAHDEHLDREVAIKVLPLGTLANDASRRRFRNEALTLSKLNHPNIATIHDFDTQQGLDFLVMEFIPGKTLSDKLGEASFSEKEVIALGTQLAEGLSAAHEHGIVHRDLKPGNLRLTVDERLKILDFGLAKLRASAVASPASETFSDTDAMAGTLPYMAPEQVLGGEIDARTDIHAAGAVLYEMATGQRAFSAVERSQLTSAILQSSTRPAESVNPRLSPEVSRIIGKCLEKEPGDRYQSARELAVDLRRFARAKDFEHAGIVSRPLWWPRVLRSKAVLVGASALLAVLLVAIFLVGRMQKSSKPAHIEPSIAVLPFVDLSPEKNQEYFSDGLAEELLNSLAKIPGLQVVARTSSFQFKGKNEDLRVVGRKLNAATVLEGSVRKQGQRVRITAQLVQTSNGYHLWSDTYDRDLTDIFAVQGDIARAVAGSLSVALMSGRVPTPKATNIEAYNAYLQGRYYYARNTPEDLEKAVSFLEQCITLDPNYAQGWAALAMAHSFQAGISAYSQEKERYGKAREEAKRALLLDPRQAEAYAALGDIQLCYEWDWQGAKASFQKALVLEPSNIDALLDSANLAATLNKFDEALGFNQRAAELDPLHGSTHQSLLFNAWWGGRLDIAEAAGHKALEVAPEFPWVHTILCHIFLARGRPQEALVEAGHESSPSFRLQSLALSYFALGRKKEADEALAELIEKHEGESTFQIGEVYCFRGELDSAMVWLERAYQVRDPGMTFVKGDPLLKNLEHDPRYLALLEKMRLLE